MKTEGTEQVGAQEEFELLCALQLCGELDEVGSTRFQELLLRSPEWQAMYERYNAVQSLLDQVPREELAEAWGRRSVGEWSRSAMGRPIAYATAALLVTAVVLGVVFVGLPQRKARTLAFPHGRCSSGGKVLGAGASVGGSLESGADSFCDVEIKDGGQVAMRLFPNSRVRFNSDPDALHVSVDRGRLLLDADRRAGSGLEVHAPGHTVRIMGTRIVISQESFNGVEVELLDGRAEVTSAIFLNVPRLQRRLSEAARQAAEKEVPSLFATRKTVLEPGRGLRLRQLGLNESDSHRLTAALDRAYGDLSLRRSATPEATAEVVARAKRVITANPELRTKLADLRLKAEVRPLSSRRRWQLERWFQGLRGDAAKPLLPGPESSGKEGRTDRRPNPVSVLRALKEERPSKLLYRIHLKNGQVLTGIVEQEGSNYRLITDRGDLMIRRDGVKNLELFLEE